MSETVECTVCGTIVGRGPNGLGLISHSLKHRREFQAVFGRQPRNYEEVRQRLPTELPPEQPTLWEALTDDSQSSIREVFDE